MLEGINGIIAARFTNKYKLPSIIFSLDETKENYKGSARSIEEVNIIEILEKNNHIKQFGGHKGAAGLTVQKDEYEAFVANIEADCANYEYKEQVLEVIEIEKNELNFKAYEDLLKLAPFGEGNPKPLFLLKDCNINEINKSKDGKHILMNISKDSSLIGFNLGNSLDRSIDKYDLIFRLEVNNMYPNRISCVCISMEGVK